MKARHRGTVYVPRRVARRTLHRSSARKHSDPTLLLPPYVTASELRVIFRLDYAGIFKLLGVHHEQGKYFWKDYDGRQFETTSKRKVMVPFEIAAVPASGLGMKPKMVDVEPDWEGADTSSAALSSVSSPLPVVAVLGHINHGKTTLLDALCGTAVAESEPGSITQGVRAMTATLAGEDVLRTGGFDMEALPFSFVGAPDAAGKRIDTQRMTFLDTPGHEAFELQRGRTMACADAAIVLVSVERGAEMQTEEVLLHAARWGVPVIFALNKIDLPTAHVELTLAELRRQCQVLLERGHVDVDWTREVEEAVPISALQRRNLEQLIAQVCKVVEGLPRLPARQVEAPTLTPGVARSCRNVMRRTDQLVGIEAAPSAIALVVEVERGADTGEKILTLIVRAGRLAIGQYFLVGTAFGRITHLAVASGCDGRDWSRAETATTGMAVKVMGVRSRKTGGDCAPDDQFFALPRERAWRLSEHRRRIEELTALQTAGPPIEVCWEHDAPIFQSRMQATFDRRRGDQPEKHANTAYERRWKQPAVQEFHAERGAAAAAGAEHSGRSAQLFSAASRREFGAPLRSEQGFSAEEADSADEAQAAASSGGRGRRSAAGRRQAVAVAASAGASEAEAEGGATRRFLALRPSPEEEGRQHEAGDAEAPGGDSAASGGGRRSASRGTDSNESNGLGLKRSAFGAWSSARTTEREFVYYTDRSSFEEEGEIDSERVRARWRWRDTARWEEERRKDQLLKDDKKLAEAMRREVFGQPPPSDSEEEDDDDEADDDDMQGADSEEDEDLKPIPLPRRSAPVVPLILKTRTVGQFDILMDEVERVQDRYGVRVAIIHGGLGPVIPKDVVHAEIEKQYGYCPIYAFQVGTIPPAVGQAEAEQIDIRRFDVFTHLVADVEQRCERIKEKAGLAAYTESLKPRPSRSGL